MSSFYYDYYSARKIITYFSSIKVRRLKKEIMCFKSKACYFSLEGILEEYSAFQANTYYFLYLL